MQMQLKCVEYCSFYSRHGIGVTNRFGSAQSLQNGILPRFVFITTTTTVEFSLGGSSPYTSAEKTKINIHKRNNTKTQYKQYKTQ